MGVSRIYSQTVRRELGAVAAVAVLAAVALPGLAPAATRDLLRDCAEDGELDRNYSRSELREAESELPSDIDEYTDCRDAIRAAQLGGPGGHGRDGAGPPSGDAGTGGPGAGGGSPEDVAALEQVRRGGGGGGGAPAVSVGDRLVKPGGGGLFASAGAANEVPFAVALALVSVAGLGLAGGVFALRRRYPAALSGAVGVLRGRPAAFRPLTGARRVALRLFRR
jgi:hypothetical protein